MMRPAEIAAARALAYGLLADLFARGVTPETRSAALASDALREAILRHAGDLDALAVEHEQAFGWAAPPFEGAFLDPSRTSGGAITEALWALFGEAGFAPDLASTEAEHLSTSLRCLAWLSGAEADALEDAHAGARERVRAIARRLFDEHLLRWLPAFASAVRRTELALPVALVEQLEALALAHRAELGGAPRGFELPEPGPLLDREETSLRDLAELLATPASSGLVLGKHDLARLGRGARLPRGFGDRVQLLLELLRSAARYDALDALLEALEREARAEEEALAHPRYAAIDALTASWRLRLERTRALIARMRADAALADREDRAGETG